MKKDTLQQFIDQLIKARGLDQESPAVMNAARKDLEERVNARVSARIAEHMPQKDWPEFEKLLDTGSDEAVQKYCAERISNLDTIVAEALLELRETWV